MTLRSTTLIAILIALPLAAGKVNPALAYRSPMASASPSPAAGGSIGGGFRASFTEYGANDLGGSGNCNAVGACGFYDNPGFNAAVSPVLFGGENYKGPGCGKCYQLTPHLDSTGRPLEGASTIVVKVNNLCPADDKNPICNQTKAGDVNKLGAEGHFDLCKDDGAAKKFFGTKNVGLATGMAVEVDCAQWSGSQDITQ